MSDSKAQACSDEKEAVPVTADPDPAEGKQVAAVRIEPAGTAQVPSKPPAEEKEIKSSRVKVEALGLQVLYEPEDPNDAEIE